MAMRYFHMSDGTEILDDHGSDLPDLASVRKQAVRATQELLKLGTSDPSWGGKPWRVWVTDEPKGAGRTITAITLSFT